jgi:hypothetical protein
VVAPPPPPIQGPPPGPANQPGLPVAPVNPAQVQADLRAVIAHAQQLGVPPPLVRALLDFLERQAGDKFPVVLSRLAQLAPPDFQQLMQEFAQTPDGQAAARGAGAPMPPPGAPGGGPPPPPPGPGGPPAQGGPPPMMGPGGPPPGMMAEPPGPPPVDPLDLPPPGVPDEEKPPKPEPWPFADEIPDARPARPSLDLVETLSRRARARWDGRNRAVDEQQGIIFLRADAVEVSGTTPRAEADGQRKFVRSAPLREFDRTVSLIEPHPEALRLQKRARRADDDGETAQ